MLLNQIKIKKNNGENPFCPKKMKQTSKMWIEFKKLHFLMKQ